jgi:tricorn protease
MKKKAQGYYRFPTIHNDSIVFVAEDDLWMVPVNGGIARRLTSNLGAVSHPCFSIDGKWIGFVGREEGDMDVYVMASDGGPAKRVTYLGATTFVRGWKGDRVILSTNASQPFRPLFFLYEAGMDGKPPKQLPYGPARTVSFGRRGVVIGRNTGDPAIWKRYRGGTAGELWIDEKGTGEFHKLIQLEGNLANPMWIGNRIYFISDHRGIGNLFSCTSNGKNLKQHTEHREYFARNATTDGKRIVYHCGADIFVFDSGKGKTQKVGIAYHTPRVQRNRKFIDAAKYLEDYDPNGDASSLAVVSRGKCFTMANWEGPVTQHTSSPEARHRLARWLFDGKRVALSSDEGGEDHLEVHWVNGEKKPKKFSDLRIGRAMEIKASPRRDEIVLTNHRNELIWVDLKNRRVKKIDQSTCGVIAGFNWSPDGNWVAYGFPKTIRYTVIKIFNVRAATRHEVTDPVLIDEEPVFDSRGRYLFFLSHRVFNPVYDNMQFDLNFPKGMRPYAVSLRKDVPSAFLACPRPFEESKLEMFQKAPKPPKSIDIEFQGIKDRVEAFPVAESIYEGLLAAGERIFYLSHDIEGARGQAWFDEELPAKASLKVFDMKKQEEATFLPKVSNFKISGNGTALVCRIGNSLRYVRAMKEAKEDLPREEKPSRATGWVDLDRIKVSVAPVSEWRQMFREAWRLQRDYFWVGDMSGINWKSVLRRYLPLVDRVASRSEFSDLIWEMQGELGTSHAYELGGDYRQSPSYKLGFLGADIVFNAKQKAYQFKRIVRGDVWETGNQSPLLRPGANVREGMLLLEINGSKLDARTHPGKLLVNLAGQEIQLTVANRNGRKVRKVCVKALGSETALRYRDWVEQNREYVHKKTNGRVGYIHIPDMGADGYAEFHRYFLTELDHDGLIVDVRFNGGGHVSGILIGKLARKRLGFDLTRWMGNFPYPGQSPSGPMVALTNEYAGSDGDIFSHAFKLMKLGKLIGRRTWGGVIGIWPRNWLVDGTITTQPEFSFWFKDVGWRVENYGTDPDIEVDITPGEYVRGIDSQLDRSIKEVLKELRRNPPLKPKFGIRPKHNFPR